MNNSSLKILIADDDEDDALLLAEALLDHLPSCQCIHATNGLDALNYIKANVNPDIVFLDLNMPEKNGINCLKDIYNFNLLPSTPVVICSTSHYIKDIKEADDFGAAYYMIKPTTYNEFTKIVSHAVDLLTEPPMERRDKSSFVLRERNLYLYN